MSGPNLNYKVDSWFMERFDDWSHSFFEHADDLSDLQDRLRKAILARTNTKRKEGLSSVYNTANCFFVLLHMLQYSFPQYRAAIPVVQELCKALYNCKETGEISQDLKTACHMLSFIETAAWFAAAWTGAEPIQTSSHRTANKRAKTTATQNDIREAFNECKARGIPANKESVREILRSKGLKRASDPLNAEIKKLKQGHS